MVFLYCLRASIFCSWNAVSSGLEAWLALFTAQSRCLMDFVALDQSARPEVISLPHPIHFPLYFKLISIHSVALFSTINIKSYKTVSLIVIFNLNKFLVNYCFK